MKTIARYLFNKTESGGLKPTEMLNEMHQLHEAYDVTNTQTWRWVSPYYFRHLELNYLCHLRLKQYTVLDAKKA